MQQDRLILRREQEKDDYRASVRKLIEKEAEPIVEEEIRKAAQELIEEQRLAIKEAVDQHRVLVREVVEEEKLAIRSRVEELRRSIMTLGMG